MTENKEKVKVGYKFVTSDLKSKNGSCQWVVGEWKHHDGDLTMCVSGLHASPTPLDSLQYTYGDSWFIVEAKGVLGEVEGDKFVCSDMKLTQEIPVSKVLVPFAIACARRCYQNYKKKYPNDKVVYAAILAAGKCFADPSKENLEAAWSAASAAWSAARSAESAESVAWSAASAARSAAWSAARSAESVARSAESAASAARSAAWSAARSAESAESVAWSAASAARSAEKQWQQRLLHRLIKKAIRGE